MTPKDKIRKYPTKYTSLIEFESFIFWPLTFLVIITIYLIPKWRLIVIALAFIYYIFAITIYILDFFSRRKGNPEGKYWK